MAFHWQEILTFLWYRCFYSGIDGSQAISSLCVLAKVHSSCRRISCMAGKAIVSLATKCLIDSSHAGIIASSMRNEDHLNTF